MGKLVEGKWKPSSVSTNNEQGAYKRIPRTFRQWIAEGGQDFPPESGRYHLYVSYACPWAHRALIFRHLKKLEDHIGVSVVHPDLLDNGWSFATDFAGATGDTLYHLDFLYELYLRADPAVTTSITVPVLWDKKNETIVNNESSEIIRMFNSAFDSLTGNHDDYYPGNLREQIDSINEKVYHTVNNGVYKAGFARTQDAYDQAVTSLFATLDALDNLLAKQQFLVGDRLTEADIRLVTTLLRFDVVYYGHFKCNLRRIADYTNLSRYLGELYALPAVAETTHFDHINRHYHYSHESINPYRIIPVGPERSFG